MQDDAIEYSNVMGGIRSRSIGPGGDAVNKMLDEWI
jgi:hypothetical protein